MKSNSALKKDRTEAYRNISRLTSSRLHLPIVYRKIHDILKKVMDAENLYIAVLEGRNHLRFPYFIDNLEPENDLQIYDKGGLTGYAIDRGIVTWIGREPDLLDRVAFLGPRPSDWIGVPMLSREGERAGLFAVQTYAEGGRYDDDELDLVEFAARQVSLALQLHLYDRELAVNRIGALVDESLELGDLYRGIHRIVADLIPAADSCFLIARIDEEAGRFKPVFWRDSEDDWDSIVWPLDRGLSAYVCSVLRDSFIFERGKVSVPEGVKPIGTMPRSWLGVPLFHGDKIIGLVVVQSYRDDDPITREDKATLSAVAPHIAAAIDRAELFELTRRGGSAGASIH
jgi:GAF domain-containing protein